MNGNDKISLHLIMNRKRNGNDKGSFHLIMNRKWMEMSRVHYI